MKLFLNGLLTLLLAIMFIFPLAAAQNSTAAYFHPLTRDWYLDYNNDGLFDKTFQFGAMGDIPVVDDWDGNGISDAGIFQPSTLSYWRLDYNNNGIADTTFQFGKNGDNPVVGDWNGEGTADVGVFRPSNGNWYLDITKTGTAWKTFQFGKNGDIPIVGDWNGEGTADVGVFRPSTGTWYLNYNKNSVIDKAFQFGKNGDIPIVGDWDDNGISDAGIFRPSTGTWYLDTTKTGTVWKSFQFGSYGDTPKVGKWYDLKFSMTNVEWYDTSDDLFPWGRNVCNVVSNWMIGSAGWSQRFYDRDGDVNDLDFGSQNSGYQGLDEAEFHYHFGHGDLLSGETYVDYSNYPTSSLTRGDVYKKWDETNKWVVFDACYVLANLQWGGALKYSHGILGFSTEKTVSTDLPDQFLRNCIDYDYTIGYSWKRATQDIYDPDDTARVIFDTESQLLNDHMSGQGYVAPNENPDDDTVYYDSWSC
jgi:hypothetical protein